MIIGKIFRNGIVIMLFGLLVIADGCSSSSDKKETSSISKQQDAKKELSVAEYCKIKKEVIDMGLANYYDKFRDKEYEEVKDIYQEYKSDKNKIYVKYGVNEEIMGNFRRVSEVREYLKKHPDMDWSNNPNFKEFNIKLYKLMMADFSANRKK